MKGPSVKRQLTALVVLVAVIYFGFAALTYVAYSLIVAIPDGYWHVAWAMVKGAVPFALVVALGLWLNQRMER